MIRNTNTIDAAIPFALPSITEEEEAAVIRVLRSRWLTTGAEAKAFEREFADYISCGGKTVQALAVNSATSGLHLALEALGVGPGDVVLVPSYTFTATAEVARYLGADIAFIDIAPDSYLMDIDKLAQTVDRLSRGLPAYPARESGGPDWGPTGTPKVVIPVHFAGVCCDMPRICAIAKNAGMYVVEDAAHSFPSLIPGAGYAGTLGDIGVYSFYATKPLACGEGGMIVSADEALLKRMSVMRLHGIDRDVFNRYTDRKASWRYDVVAPGFKYNMSDLLAAIGRVQLAKSDRLLTRRLELGRRYDEAFAGDGRFLVPPTSPEDARYLYPLRVDPVRAPDRDSCIESLQAQGIGVSVHFIPLHTMTYYRERYGCQPEDFPETLARFSQTISLPIWPDLSDGEQDRVIQAIRGLAR